MGKIQLKAAIRGLKTTRRAALEGKDRVGLAAAGAARDGEDPARDERAGDR